MRLAATVFDQILTKIRFQTIFFFEGDMTIWKQYHLVSKKGQWVWALCSDHGSDEARILIFDDPAEENESQRPLLSLTQVYSTIY